MEPLELRRQAFHLMVGILVVVLLHFRLIRPVMLVWLLVIGLILSLVSMRWRIPLISWFLDSFDRKPMIPGQGALTFILGCILSLWFFPMHVALASILILAIGDSVSVIIGQGMGRLKSPWNARYLEGTAAAIILSALAAWIFVPFWTALTASAVSLILEALELSVMGKRLDDNIWLPVVAGAVMILIGKMIYMGNLP
jgi:dolichol kinase